MKKQNKEFYRKMRKSSKKTDVFKKYLTIKKIVGSKALPVAICITIVFIICLFGLVPGLSFINLIEIDVVISVGLVTIVTWIIAFLEKYINRRIEEMIKLNSNYQDHIKKYNKESMYTIDEKKYPLIELASDIKDVVPTFIDTYNYQLDPVIVHYMSELMSAHKTSKFKNKRIYRVDKLEIKNGIIYPTLSLSDMYKTLLTNRVMDFEIHNHITVREVFEPGPKLNSFENSKLCNGLGFNFIIKTLDGYYALVKKTGKNPTSKFKYSTCSSTLQPHFNEEDTDYLGLLKQLSYNALITNFNYPKPKNDKEAKDIYKIILDEDIHYLGLVRNLIEGGKPELCYVLDLHISSKELLEQFNKTTSKTNNDRGNKKIIIFKENEYNILDNDKVLFNSENHIEHLPIIPLYILEKLR